MARIGCDMSRRVRNSPRRIDGIPVHETFVNGRFAAILPGVRHIRFDIRGEANQRTFAQNFLQKDTEAIVTQMRRHAKRLVEFVLETDYACSRHRFDGDAECFMEILQRNADTLRVVQVGFETKIG